MTPEIEEQRHAFLKGYNCGLRFGGDTSSSKYKGASRKAQNRYNRLEMTAWMNGYHHGIAVRELKNI